MKTTKARAGPRPGREPRGRAATSRGLLRPGKGADILRRILVINTGSTSTKLAVFEDLKNVFETNVSHSAEEIGACGDLLGQYPMRLRAIRSCLEENSLTKSGFDAVAARGGTFGYAKGGAYLVEENLLAACRDPITNHPSNLSANEVTDMARRPGLAEVKRRPFSHVLNTRAVARDVAAKLGKRYEDLNIIVAHLGGGISVNLHVHGRIVDLCSDDEGPMSPERAGSMNGKSYVDMCYSGKFTKAEMMRHIKGEGGLVSHLGTSSLIEVEERIDAGDSHADFVLDTMAYQIAKAIGALAAAACGEIDAVILTGGCAHSRRLTERISERVRFIAPVAIVPGAKEMEALAEGITRVLEGKENYSIYEKSGGQ